MRRGPGRWKGAPRPGERAVDGEYAGAAHRSGRTERGFTLVEISIVLGIIFILASLAYPSIQKVRSRTHRQMCINNLRQIYYAKEQWAMAMGKTDGESTDESAVLSYIKEPLACPSNGTYDYGVVGANPTCDIAEHELP